MHGNYDYSKYGANYNYTPNQNYKSSMREYTAEIMSENKDVMLFGKSNVTWGFKNIFRQNTTSSWGKESYSVQQLYMTDSRSLTKKLSSYLILKGETDNLGPDRSYLFLPTLKLNYNMGKAGNISLTYGRNVSRPSSNQLNTDTLRLSSYQLIVGNKNLKNQNSDNVRLSYSKQIKHSYLTVALGYDYIDNMISQIYMDENNLSTATYQNIGCGNNASLSLSLMKTLCKGRMNLNMTATGSYQKFSVRPSCSTYMMVKPANGYSYSLSFAGTYLTTKQWMYTATINYKPKRYSLNAVSHQNPMIYLEVTKPLFHDKLELSLYTFNTLVWFNRSHVNYNYRNFWQYSERKSHVNNICVTLTYHFGKRFRSRDRADDVSNNDTKLSKPQQ